MASVTNATIKAAKFESTQATGTAPLTVASTTVVTNLNADKLDGQEGTYYLALTNATGSLAATKGGTGLTAAGAANTVLGSDGTDLSFAKIVDANIDAAAAIGWSKVSKTGSSLADLATRSAADLSSGTLLDARVAESNVTQHEAALTVLTSQLSGTLLDATVAESNVTQHEDALSIATTQLTGTLADATVAESNVTQHEAALSLTYSQISNASAGLDAVQAISALGTALQVVRMNSGATALEFATVVADAFASIENSTGTEQFAASGADVLQFAAGSDLAVAFDNVNKRITFSYTGASGGGMTGLQVEKEGVLIGSRAILNLHEGSGVTLTVTDDAVDGEIDLTIAASTVGDLDDLSDVDITAAASGDLLRHDGTSWVDYPETSLSIATTQLTGTLSDATVAESNVTQHEAALSIATSQLTGTITTTFSGALVYKSGSQSGPGNSNPYVLTWDSEKHDTDGYHSTASNTSRLTAQADGYHRLYSFVALANFGSSQLSSLTFRIDGTTSLGSGGSKDAVTGDHMGASIDVHLTAGQYVEVLVVAPGGITGGDLTKSYFGMSYIGA